MTMKPKPTSRAFILKMIAAILVVLITTPNAAAEPVHSAMNTPEIQKLLTAEEKRWLAAHRTIRIAGPKAFPPFHYYEKDGTLMGMAPDYIDLVFRLLNLKSEIDANLPWPEVLEKAKKKQIDLISCLARTAEREVFLSFSDPYLSFPLVIITRMEAPFVGGLVDLSHQKVTFVKGAAAYEWIRNDHVDIRPQFVATPLDALRAVSLGNAEAHIDNLAAASYLIQQHGLSNLKVAAPTAYDNYNLYMAVREDWRPFIGILNKVLDAITSQQHAAIRNKWLAVRYEHGIRGSEIIKWFIGVAGIMAVVFLFILIWNRRLKRVIQKQRQAENQLESQLELMRTLLDNLRVGVFMVEAPMGKPLLANRRALELLGRGILQDADKSSLAEVYQAYKSGTEEIYPGNELPIVRGLSGEHHSVDDLVVIQPSGKRVYLEVFGSPVRDRQGEVIASLVSFSDITDRKASEAAIRKSEENFRRIFENSVVGFFQSTPEGRFTTVNRAFARMLGYDSPEDLMSSITDIASQYYSDSKDRQKYQDILRKKGKVDGFEFKAKCKDGREIWISNSTRAYFDERGKAFHYEGAIRDITDRKQYEMALQQTRAFLETAINQSPSGILLADAPDVRIRIANPAAQTILGGAMEEINGIVLGEHSDIWQTHYPDGVPYDAKDLPLSTAVLEGKISTNVDLMIRNRLGKEYRVSANASPIRDASGTIQAGIVVFHDITDRMIAEWALQESEERFRTLVEKSPLGIALIGKDGRYKYINPRFTEIFGYTLEEVPTGSQWLTRAYPDEKYRQKVVETWLADLNRIEIGKARPRVFSVTCRDGSRKEIHFRPVTMENLDQFIIYEDITLNRKMEKQLQQAKKFEAIGTLAGGVAHDFNNLLMGIQGRTSLITVSVEPNHPHMEHIEAIEDYIKSATDLTRQLLGFARGGKYEVKPISIDELVLSSAAMFGRTRKEITIHTKTKHTPIVIEADRGQIEQVLLNMYVNAWQAMPDGGELFVEVKTVSLDETYCAPYGVKPGHFAKISVTDTGTGMDEATRGRVFDPFFTTKEMSRGTGLGLASAYGIVKNHDGIVTVYSEVGHGTTFNIYLRISSNEIRPEAVKKPQMLKGSGTILIVDDEKMIIEVAKAMLKKLGYQVVISRDGQQAVEVITQMDQPIDLVILDLIMPGMDGRKTFDRIRSIRPGMPVLLSSGYAISGQATDIMARGCNGFIQKPFNIYELSRKVKRILDDVGRSGRER